MILIDGKEERTKIEYKLKNRIQFLFDRDKIRTVIYFIDYNAKLQYNDFNNYVEICNLINDIYQCRNTNHRGSTPMPYKKEEVTTKIFAMRSFYYFKFMGVVVQFIDFVKNGIKGLPEMVKYARTLQKIEIPSRLVINVSSTKSE